MTQPAAADPDTMAIKMMMLSVSLPPALHERVLRTAQAERRSISAVIRNLLEDHLPPPQPRVVSEGGR